MAEIHHNMIYGEPVIWVDIFQEEGKDKKKRKLDFYGGDISNLKYYLQLLI